MVKGRTACTLGRAQAHSSLAASAALRLSRLPAQMLCTLSMAAMVSSSSVQLPASAASSAAASFGSSDSRVMRVPSFVNLHMCSKLVELAMWVSSQGFALRRET